MAKRGRKPQKNNLSELLRKPELWVGVFTVGILLGVAGGVAFKNRGYLKLNRQESTSIVSPIPSPEASPSASVIKTPKISQVKKLAYTSSTVEVEVLANESYWKIAKRVCGDAKHNFLTIQALNENSPLHPGMMVKVACE